MAGWCWRPSCCRAKPRASKSTTDIHAGLVEVLEPAAERVTPPCPLFARCGGCHYQHAPYEFQLARKVEILREQLRRVGKIEYQGEIEVVSGPPLGYRNRAQFHIAERTHRISRGALARAGSADRRLPDLFAARESGAGR